MEIIDLRPYSGLNTRILDYKTNEIIFSKDNKIEEKYYYCISRYNLNSNTVEEIYRYEIPHYEFYNQYAYIFGEEIFIIKMKFPHKVEIDILNKITKKIKSMHSFEIKEEITSIPISINNRYFVFYGDIDEMNERKYTENKEKGYSHYLYLCDLSEDKIYFIKDLRLVDGLSVVHGLINKLPTFIHDNQQYLIFNETYMDDWEYEDINNLIQSNKLSKDLVKEIEALYLININDFVKTIKIGEQNVPFKVICKRHINGWVRYLGMDDKNIYFREKDFITQIEKIFAINKTNFESTVVKEINHKDVKGRLIYDNNKIYEEIESDDSIEIKGIYNCDYNLCFKKDRNISFEEYINNRYLIISQWIEDTEDNYYEFVHITDTKENKCIKYEGRCHIYDSHVILY